MTEYKHYLTTPLYYVNSKPHIGHTYTTVVCDTIKRYYDLLGERTYFLTGTDEHGEKIEEAAKNEKIPVDVFVDRNSDSFRKMWDNLDIDYDDFIRTTESRHKSVVRHLLQKLYEKGDIYKSSYEGKYCTGCERYLTDSELIEGKCPDHRVEPKTVKEDNYFFRLTKYVGAMKKHIEENPDFIRPEKFRNEVLGYLTDERLQNAEEGDLCISRPKERLQWGIELPFDKNFVTYVWFDALTNYISAIGYPDKKYEAKWSVSEHFIAKDILRTHSVYWGTMLIAADVPLYRKLNVHGYWNMSGTKMSKSLGNVVEPGIFKKTYGDENLRYFFLREMHWGEDADFTIERFVSRYNSDLANNFGNLISRTMGMVGKYYQEKEELDLSSLPPEHALKDELTGVIHSYKKDFRNYEFYRTLEKLWFLFDDTNKFIADSSPWELAKQKETEKLNAVIFPVLEIIRISTYLLYPVMPKKVSSILNELGTPNFRKISFDDFVTWGYFKKLNSKYETKRFFDRIEEPLNI